MWPEARLPAHTVSVGLPRRARVFDLTGRPMKGWLLVDAEGCAEDGDMQRWVYRGIAYARSLPPK